MRQIGPLFGVSHSAAHRVIEHPVRQRQTPLPTSSSVRDRCIASIGHRGHQLAELAELQPGERDDPL
jgi:hypothetical protein